MEKFRKHNKEYSVHELVDQYFVLMDKIQKAQRDRNYSKLIQFCQMSLALIEPFIQQSKQMYGKFVASSIPAIEVVLPHYAILGQRGQIENIREMIDYFPELEPWRRLVDEAFEMNKIAGKLYKYLKENPNTLQKNLKKIFSSEDRNLIYRVLHYMESHNKIEKIKSGNTYALKTK